MDRAKKRPRLTHPDSDTLSQSSSISSNIPVDVPMPYLPCTKKLIDLLDTRVISSNRDLEFRFGEIARSLIHEHLLSLSSSGTKQSKAGKATLFTEETYELVEVEFYLRKEGHEDPFAHATSEQSFSGRWYFHRSPRKSSNAARSATSLTGFRGGTRKGVDLTFGGPVALASSTSTQDNSTRGGILLRSMRRISDGTFISGPSLLVDELLRASGAPTVGSLVSDYLGSSLSAFQAGESAGQIGSQTCSINLQPRNSAVPRRPVVYNSPRIGLELSHPGTTSSASDPRIVFVQKLYRFFIQPHLLTANGRVQTFLGLYLMLSEAEILSEDSLLQEVSRIAGLNYASVAKYASEYSHGREKGRIDQFIGPTGKGAASSPAQYLRMMGTLRRISRDKYSLSPKSS